MTSPSSTSVVPSRPFGKPVIVYIKSDGYLEPLQVAALADDGLVAVRDRATEIWHSTDPALRSYVELLALDPEHWRCECEDAHLVEWYRVLMAPYLIATPALAHVGFAVRHQEDATSSHRTRSYLRVCWCT